MGARRPHTAETQRIAHLRTHTGLVKQYTEFERFLEGRLMLSVHYPITAAGPWESQSFPYGGKEPLVLVLLSTT